MSVLIKGMEMPESCVGDGYQSHCPCYCSKIGYCQAVNRDEHEYIDILVLMNKTKPDWCPLVPVPPHGRLIDADVVARYLQKMSEDVEKSFPYFDKNDALMIERGIQFARQYILNLAPTVIEAENE